MVKKILIISVLLLCTACSAPVAPNSLAELREVAATAEATADAPDGEVSSVRPFDGKAISRIDIHCNFDLYDPVELSAEDSETLSEMLGRVELVGEKMDRQKLIPYSGNSPASFTVFFEDGEKVGFAAESGIGYPDGTDGGAYIIDGDYYAVDKQIVYEITDFYDDVLLDKYIPEYRASYAPDPRDLESAEAELREATATDEATADAPDGEVSSVRPFDGKAISRIDIHCRLDKYDPVELSAEDRETLSEMLRRVELVGEKMDVRELIPYSGNSPASFTIFFEDGEKVRFSAESGIVYPDWTDGGAYIIDGDYYAVDRDTVREITNFYHDVLLDKYIPEYRASYAPDPRDTESAKNEKTDEAFMPFVKTVFAEYAYIEIVPGGLSGFREDGSVVEPARLSDEDAESVFELLRQIRIEKPPLNKHAWESPEGGYGAIFQVSRYISSMSDDVSTLTVIPGGKVVMISEINFLADEEVVSELCDLYDELYCKYYPDLAEKWLGTCGR